MRDLDPYLLHQLVRFGHMTGRQMAQVCAPFIKRTATYDLANALISDGLAVRSLGKKGRLIVYSAAKAAESAALGKGYERPQHPRTSDLHHTIMRTDVMLMLARYSNVLGIATEHEVTKNDAKELAHNRLPDGIIQIKRPDTTYELAVEVETSKKAFEHVKSVLDAYKKTLEGKYYCRGALIVASDEYVENRYNDALMELPQSVKNRIIVRRLSELSSLNPEYWGSINNTSSKHVGLKLNRTRITSAGVAEYVPANLSTYITRLAANPYIEVGQSQTDFERIKHE